MKNEDSTREPVKISCLEALAILFIGGPIVYFVLKMVMYLLGIVVVGFYFIVAIIFVLILIGSIIFFIKDQISK